MKRTGFYLSIALSSSLLALLVESDNVYSCGPGVDYEKYRVSYVDPDLLSDSLYRSFYRTILRPHQEIDNYNREEYHGYAYPGSSDPAEENLSAWSDYFDGEIPERSLRRLIYETTSEEIDRLGSHITAGTPLRIADSIVEPAWEGAEPDTIFRADAWRAIVRRSDLPFLDYLDYATRADDHAWEADPDTWIDADEGKDTVAMESLIEEGITRYRQTTSDELKLRYGFQVLRLARYLGRYDRVEIYYRTMVSHADPLHPVRLMALSHLAGARLRSGDVVGGSELFTHLFDTLASRRVYALRDARVERPAVWRELYERTTSPEQRATLHLMRGLKERRLSFDYVRNIYDVAPRSAKLELALFRELHRIESYLYDDMVTRDLTLVASGERTGWEYDPESGEYVERPTNVAGDPWESREHHMVRGGGWDTLFYFTVDHDAAEEADRRRLDTVITGRDYVSAFRRFVLAVAREGEITEPALWYMVAGYIDIMDGDYHVADECLEEATKMVGGNYGLRQQIRLLEYLRHRMTDGDGRRPAEEIAEALAWMERRQEQNRHSKFDRTMVELGRRYLVDGDIPRAVLAFDRAEDLGTRNLLLDMYAGDEELLALQEMVTVGAENALDRMLLDSFSLSPLHLRDIRATRMMRRGEYREAQDLYGTIPASYWAPTGDPGETACFRFTTNRVVVDTNLPTGIPQGGEATELRVTRREFAGELVAALDRIEASSGPQKTAALVAVADLLYNAPYWGYNSVVWDGSLLWRIRFSYFGATAWPLNIPGVAERMESAEEEFYREYGSRQAARAWYEKAVADNADRELAARAAYMLDLCDKQPATSLHSRPTIAEQPREGYGLLMRRYRDTETGGKILSRCSVYRYF